MKIKTTKIVGLLLTMLVLVATLGAFAITASAAESSATLSFANKAQRTTFTTSQQIWEQNGIKLTNNKGSSTSNVADYANPARFYKNSNITVAMSGKLITKIVFECASGYADELQNSITSGGTVTVSSNKVTVTLSTPAESFTISNLSGGQVRMNSLTVTYTENASTPDTPVCEHENKSAPQDAGNGNHEFVCEDCGEVISVNAHTAGTPTDIGNGKHQTVCTVCNAVVEQKEHTATIFTDNGDGTHKSACAVCGAIVDATADHENLNYTNNGDGTHKVECADCDAVVNAAEAHNLKENCPECGYIVPGQSFELTITFNDKSKRTEYSTSIQVWEENGIKLTNNKGSGNNIGDYANPARFYKDSEVIIEFAGMTKIEIDCAGIESKYVTPWTESLEKIANCTVVLSNNIVTVTFNSPVDSFTFVATAQIRANSITVYGKTPAVCEHEETVCTDLGIGMHQIACAECEEVLSTEAHDGIVCSKCDAIAPIEFAAWSLILQDNLALNYAIDARFFAEGLYTNPVVTFTIGDRTVTVTEFDTEKYAGYYAFIFSDLAPHQMGENVSATISATLNGKTVTTTTTKSIKNYCMQILNDASQSAKAKTLVVDLLNYGAASQTYVNKGTEGIVLVNADLTDEQKALGTQKTPSLKSAANAFYTTIENATVTWEGAHLYLIDTVEMKFVFKAESTEGLTVKITTDAGKNYTVTSFEEYTSGTAYVATFDVFSACQMSEIVYVTVFDAQGNAVSNTYRYSIESYAAAMQFNNDTNLANLVKAMMVYGNSAKAYNE